MEEYFIKIIQWNFIGVSSLLTLFLFMRTDVSFDKQSRRYFTLTGAAIILLIIFDSAAMYFETPTDDLATQNVHTVLNMICYADKPIIVMFLLFIVLRKKSVRNVLYLIPAILNILAAISVLFGPWVFSYHNQNVFQRGFLGYTAHITALLYALLIVNESLKRFKDKNYYEGGVVIWILIITMIATMLDSETYTRLVNSSSGMCLLIYYFYFYFQLSKRDIMTDAFNRNAYYSDMLLFEKQISAMMLFNMGELYFSFDKNTESIWEKSLMSMVSIIRKNISSTARLYRFGGDEFVVLCLNEQKEAIRLVFENIKKDMKHSEYLFASGLAFNDRNRGLDELLSRADEAMRVDKSNIKARRVFQQRLMEAEAAAKNAENEQL